MVNFNKISSLKEVKETGFWIDVKGEAISNQNQNEKNIIIALRTDIDGLPLQEENSIE